MENLILQVELLKMNKNFQCSNYFLCQKMNYRFSLHSDQADLRYFLA